MRQSYFREMVPKVRSHWEAIIIIIDLHYVELLGIPALLVHCLGNSPATGEFLSQRTVTRNFDVFFDLRLNKRLS